MNVYTAFVQKRVPGCDCGKTHASWGEKQVFDKFYSERERLMLNLAKAVKDPEWEAHERTVLAGCRPTQAGELRYLVTYGKPATVTVCADAPSRHHAAGIAGGVAYHKVCL